jgi:hypothetical protein
MRRIVKLLALSMFVCGLAKNGTAQKRQLRFLRDGQTAKYPPAALVANIFGNVEMLIEISEGRSAVVSVLSGPPALTEAARKNVETWKFTDHAPKSLRFTFRYQIVGTPTCGIGKTTVRFSTPSELVISSRPVMTCDP